MCAYLAAFLLIPVLLVSDISVFESNATLRAQIAAGVNTECSNAIDALVGFIVCYTLLISWLLGLCIMKMHTVAECIEKQGDGCGLFLDIYYLVGAIQCVILCLFNVAVTYWISRPAFVKTCGQSTSVDLSTVLYINCAAGHILFDSAVVIMTFLIIRWYQWL